MKKPLLIVVVVVSAQLTSCFNEPFDRKAMLESLGSDVVIPMYEAFADETATLVDDAKAFCNGTSGSRLEDLQDQWKAARFAWKRTEIINFGPSVEQPWRLGPKIDSWPVREDTVEANLASDQPLTFEVVRTLGASSRGLATMEYLIFDPDGVGIALEKFENDDNGQRCNYTVALAEDLQVNADAMVRAWSPQGDDYLGDLLAAGEPGAPFMSIRDATNEVVNRMLFLTENIMREKLGAPLGLDSGGAPRPERVESPYSDHSIEDILANLEGLENLYRGRFESRQGIGVQLWVRWYSPDVDWQMLTEITESRWAIEAIPPPLRHAVVNDPELVRAAYDQIRELRNAIGVDVINALAGSVTFNETDGD